MNLSSNPIFRGISEEELGEIFSLSYTRQNSYEKNQIIFHSGDTIHEIGIILNGSVHIEMIDFWGNKSILSSFGAGQVFAETYALCKEPMLVDDLVEASGIPVRRVLSALTEEQFNVMMDIAIGIQPEV